MVNMRPRNLGFRYILGWPRKHAPLMAEGFATVKVREAIKLIEDDGWFLVRTRGSHRQYKHAQKPGLVTIAGKPSDDLAPGTKNSILKQAGLK
jgi:predicted RNA binding protein YcfA (HicA-like mRNA interferase family)